MPGPLDYSALLRRSYEDGSLFAGQGSLAMTQRSDDAALEGTVASSSASTSIPLARPDSVRSLADALGSIGMKCAGKPDRMILAYIGMDPAPPSTV